MNTPDQTAVLVLVLLTAVAGIGALVAFRTGARGGYKVARQTQEVTRMGGTLARALATAAVLVTVQWGVLAYTSDPRAWGVVLGLPAIFAGATIARMFAVTELVHGDPARKGGRR